MSQGISLTLKVKVPFQSSGYTLFRVCILGDARHNRLSFTGTQRLYFNHDME